MVVGFLRIYGCINYCYRYALGMANVYLTICYHCFCKSYGYYVTAINTC